MAGTAEQAIIVLRQGRKAQLAVGPEPAAPAGEHNAGRIELVRRHDSGDVLEAVQKDVAFMCRVDFPRDALEADKDSTRGGHQRHLRMSPVQSVPARTTARCGILKRVRMLCRRFKPGGTRAVAS